MVYIEITDDSHIINSDCYLIITLDYRYTSMPLILKMHTLRTCLI